jgi:hypothetical protein
MAKKKSETIQDIIDRIEEDLSILRDKAVEAEENQCQCDDSDDDFDDEMRMRSRRLHRSISAVETLPVRNG